MRHEAVQLITAKKRCGLKWDETQVRIAGPARYLHITATATFVDIDASDVVRDKGRDEATPVRHRQCPRCGELRLG
jgi:hypothetical protein